MNGRHFKYFDVYSKLKLRMPVQIRVQEGINLVPISSDKKHLICIPRLTQSILGDLIIVQKSLHLIELCKFSICESYIETNKSMKKGIVASNKALKERIWGNEIHLLCNLCHPPGLKPNINILMITALF